MFCVYLTIYRGNKLPPFYIGSTSVQNIERGYHGSVTSEKYKKVWNDELRQNAHLFSTKIVGLYKERKQALLREEQLQRTLKVVFSPLYVNQAYANKGFVGQKHVKTRAHIDRIRDAKKGKKLSSAARASVSKGKTGIKLSMEHRQNIGTGLCKTYVLRDPCGNLITVSNLKQFCEDHQLAIRRLTRTEKSKKPVAPHGLSDKPKTVGWLVVSSSK